MGPKPSSDAKAPGAHIYTQAEHTCTPNKDKQIFNKGKKNTFKTEAFFIFVAHARNWQGMGSSLLVLTCTLPWVEQPGAYFSRTQVPLSSVRVFLFQFQEAISDHAQRAHGFSQKLGLNSLAHNANNTG